MLSMAMHDLINVDFSLLYSYFVSNIFKWSYLAQKWLFWDKSYLHAHLLAEGFPMVWVKKFAPNDFLKAEYPLGP